MEKNEIKIERQPKQQGCMCVRKCLRACVYVNVVTCPEILLDRADRVFCMNNNNNNSNSNMSWAESTLESRAAVSERKVS